MYKRFQYVSLAFLLFIFLVLVDEMDHLCIFLLMRVVKVFLAVDIDGRRS